MGRPQGNSKAPVELPQEPYSVELFIPPSPAPPINVQVSQIGLERPQETAQTSSLHSTLAPLVWSSTVVAPSSQCVSSCCLTRSVCGLGTQPATSSLTTLSPTRVFPPRTSPSTCLPTLMLTLLVSVKRGGTVREGLENSGAMQTTAISPCSVDKLLDVRGARPGKQVRSSDIHLRGSCS